MENAKGYLKSAFNSVKNWALDHNTTISGTLGGLIFAGLSAAFIDAAPSLQLFALKASLFGVISKTTHYYLNSKDRQSQKPTPGPTAAP